MRGADEVADEIVEAGLADALGALGGEDRANLSEAARPSPR